MMLPHPDASPRPPAIATADRPSPRRPPGSVAPPRLARVRPRLPERRFRSSLAYAWSTASTTASTVGSASNGAKPDVSGIINAGPTRSHEREASGAGRELHVELRAEPVDHPRAAQVVATIFCCFACTLRSTQRPLTVLCTTNRPSAYVQVSLSLAFGSHA